MSVKKTSETLWPKEYSWRPETPTAFMMEALWTMRTGMRLARARRMMSIWVVALSSASTGERGEEKTDPDVPKGVSDDEEGDVLRVCVV